MTSTAKTIMASKVKSSMSAAELGPRVRTLRSKSVQPPWYVESPSSLA